MEDIEIIKKNCVGYVSTHGKAIDVLKKADGKNQYKDIADSIGIHNTTVSTLLKKAEKFGLVAKNKFGIYKKKTGILGYIPKITTASSLKTVQSVIKKLNNPKKKKNLDTYGLTIPSTIEINIDKMAEAYRSLYAVENVLRVLIRKVFFQKINWWKNNVPIDIQQKVVDEILRTVYHAVKRKDELEYTHLGQLKEIIILKKNWNDFLPFIKEKDKSSFAATINKAIPSRNAIGHCIPLTTQDLRVVEVRFSDILKMIA